MEQTITVRAFAKINIGLRILNKRPDGYHNLETVFYEVEPFDELSLVQSETVELQTDAAMLPVDESNLCLKAVRLLQNETNRCSGVRIYLRKKIPMGAGLGGGSSDAAATLVGLNKLWDLGLSVNELRQMAGRLGSDVAFFVEGGCAYATGRGEHVQHFEFSVPYWILVVTPQIHVSTAWAYQSLNLQESKMPLKFHVRLPEIISDPALLSKEVTNDFEDAVFAAYPEIYALKVHMIESGALFALMSGSGSSVFAFFDSKETAVQSAASLPATYAVSLTPPQFSPKRDEK